MGFYIYLKPIGLSLNFQIYKLKSFFGKNFESRQKTVLGDAIVTNYVKSQARRLAKDTTNSVINDPQVQANLSAAIYGAITPSLFSRKKNTPVITASEKSPSLVEEERDSIREQFDSSQGVEIDPDDVYP